MSEDNRQLQDERLNWADVAIVAVTVLSAAAAALYEGLTRIRVGLMATSRDIDDRREFVRLVTRDIDDSLGGKAS